MIDVKQQLEDARKELFNLLGKGGLNHKILHHTIVINNKYTIIPKIGFYMGVDGLVKKTVLVSVVYKDVIELGFYDPQLVQKIKKLTA